MSTPVSSESGPLPNAGKGVDGVGRISIPDGDSEIMAEESREDPGGGAEDSRSDGIPASGETQDAGVQAKERRLPRDLTRVFEDPTNEFRGEVSLREDRSHSHYYYSSS